MIVTDLAGFAASLAAAQAGAKAAAANALERAAQVVEAEAKAEIGEYQPDAGPFAAWQALADSTLREKERLGFAPPDNPLLRTGELRDSIGHEVDAEAREAVIGSASDIAVYQELGTDRIPPRSFLGGALVRKTDEVLKICGDGVVGALIGGSGQTIVGGLLP